MNIPLEACSQNLGEQICIRGSGESPQIKSVGLHKFLRRTRHRAQGLTAGLRCLGLAPEGEEVSD